ncbi:MAG: nuclear transport factor 2 family protein [Bryobacteraceae bacterium]
MELENIQLVREAFSEFVRRDLRAILNHLADNVEWVEPGGPDIPYAGVFYGHGGVLKFFERLWDSVELLRFEPRHFTAAGDLVGAFGWWQAKAKATGRVLESPWSMLFTIRDGKIVRFETFVDTATTAGAFRQEKVAASGL